MTFRTLCLAPLFFALAACTTKSTEVAGLDTGEGGSSSGRGSLEGTGATTSNTGGSSTSTGGNGAMVEAIMEQDYVVRNETDSAIEIAATDLSGAPTEFRASMIPAGEEALIYHAVEGTGGHTLPSNFFSSLTITADDSVLYEGVENGDWKREGELLVLIVTGPAEELDFSCQTADDCSIENVGNCCGYYPRCINKNSPIPPACPDGGLGVCGWPEISHCECVESTCRSMQGSDEI